VISKLQAKSLLLLLTPVSARVTTAQKNNAIQIQIMAKGCAGYGKRLKSKVHCVNMRTDFPLDQLFLT
jgi:hypothetical protein